MDYKLSLIIVSYKKPDLVGQCLESIYRYNDIGNQLEIIVSDNSPDDSVYELIKEKYPNIKYLKNGNIGFGAANNRGVTASSAPYILFLNPDTILVEPIFSFAVEIFETGFGMFGLQLVDCNLKKNTSYAFIDCFSLTKAFFGKLCNRIGIFIPEKMAIIGADIFIKKELFLGCGSFDENIFMYAEENDLSKRFHNTYPDTKIGFFPEKKIIHLEGGTTQVNYSEPNKFVQGRMKTYIYYCSKWGIELKKVIRFFSVRYYLLAVISRIKGNRPGSFFYQSIGKKYREELKDEKVH